MRNGNFRLDKTWVVDGVTYNRGVVLVGGKKFQFCVKYWWCRGKEDLEPMVQRRFDWLNTPPNPDEWERLIYSHLPYSTRSRPSKI